MKKLKTMAAFFLLFLIMAASVTLPPLLSKANDRQLIGQIHLQKLETKQDVTLAPENGVIDKLRLLYDKLANSKDIVVVKNIQLSETELNKIKSSCYAELQKLKGKKLFPDIEVDLDNGFDVSSFICANTSMPDFAVNFFIISIYSAQYRISFIIDADTNKIYGLNISSAMEPLDIDYNNAPLNWKDYMGLSFVKADNSGKASDDDYADGNGPFPSLNNMIRVFEDDYTNVTQPVPYVMARALENNYTDGNKMVNYFFEMTNDNKSFTISWSFQ